MQEMNPYIARHLAISDKLLDWLDRALDDPRGLFYSTVRRKAGRGEEEDVCDTVDERKLCAVVDAISELKDIQRQALGFMDPKDRVRYESELQKHAGPSGEAVSSFLEALGLSADREENAACRM